MNVDYIIIGQGLAGTLLSHELIKAGQRVLVIDQGHRGAASKVAAGIINPITGRRFVKSWRIDQLLPMARQTYGELEDLLGEVFFRPGGLIRTLFNHGEENDWFARTGETSYQQYISEEVVLGRFQQFTVLAFSYGEVLQAAQVNVGLLVEKYAAYLGDRLVQEKFDYSKLEIGATTVRYKTWEAPKVIFCEGYRVHQNPWFNYLPFGGAKGEVLIVRIPGVRFKKMLKHRIFIVPLEEDLYWVGATYDWNFENEEPTVEGHSFLKDRLEDFLKVPYEIVAHKAAVRPTVKDRRPFLGVHPEWPGLALFNGLGTKGASLGPFWAHHMKDFLLKNISLDREVSIERFAPRITN